MAANSKNTMLTLGWVLVVLFAICQLGPIVAP